MDDSEPRSDDMADGLRAAFGGDTSLPRSSVLRLLQQRVGSRLGLHLPEADEAADPPVRIDEEAKALRDPTGRYQVLGEIGRGGVGIVYKGRDQDLGRDVAMKVLRADYAARPEILERFVEEAQIGGQLQHPGIVPVYELGLQHGERPYFAMKLVKGETLAAQLGRRANPADDRRRLLGIFEQVCQTLAYAHARAVVHRDLKPANVMIGSYGEVQVVDWGFAKVLPKGDLAADAKQRRTSSVVSVISTVRSHPETGSHSVVGSMLGTPAYMPPEQALGDVEHMDQRSDVFGLGAMLCEILTGQPPYLAADGDLIQQAARADLQRAFARIEQSGADATLVTLCKQCLSPASKARPASGKQVAEAIAQYLHSVEERARQAQIRAAEARVRARATVWLCAAAVLVLALGGGGYLFVEQQAQARRGQATQRVVSALSEANVRLGQARTAGVRDLGPWTRALDAASQAEVLAADADVAAEQRDAVAALLATVRDERSRAEGRAARIARDEAMRRRLFEVRIPSDADHDPIGKELREARRSDHAYAAAFRDHLDGRDVTTMTAAAGAGALAGDLAVELAAALDHWVFGRLSLVRSNAADPPDAAITARLQEIAIALDPDQWRNRLRSVCAQQHADKDALVRLQAEADLRSLPAVSLELLASALLNAGATEAARAVYLTAYDSHPTDFGCMFALGRLYAKGKEPARALACFRVARALRPDLREVRHAIGMALESRRDRAALGVFRDLAQEEPDNGHWQFHLGTISADAGKNEEAVAFYRRSIELDPGYAIAHNNLALSLLRLRRFEQALASSRRAVELDASDSGVHTGLGRVLEGMDELDEALAAHRRAIELDANDACAHNGLGTTLGSLHRRDEAILAFRRAIELEPTLANAHHNLGLALEAVRRREEAIASYRRAIELDPRFVDTHHNLGASLANMGRFDEAVASYRRAIELEPKAALTHHNLGVTFAKLGRLDEAIASYRAAIDADPKLVATHRALADLLQKQGKLDGAIACLRRVVELEPEQARGHAELGAVLLEQRRPDEALVWLRRAIELDPTRAGTHCNLCYALRDLGLLEEAITHGRRAVELDPERAAAHHSLGLALQSHGELDEAIACCRRGIALDANLAQIHYLLGSILQTHQKFEEAGVCYRRAIELAANDTLAHHGLGFVLYAQGKVEDAIASYRHAIELDPGAAVAHHNLAIALHRQGRLDEAVESLRRARAIWSPQHHEAARESLAKVQAHIVWLEGELAKVPERLALARGERTTGSKDEFVAAAHLVYQRGEYVLAVRTYERSVAAFPELSEEYAHHYNAACAAALAGCGKGSAAAANDAERATLRGQAREWLAAQLVRWRTGLAEASTAVEAARQVAHALQDPDFAGLRGDAALAALPADEGEAWRTLWKELEQAAGKQQGN